MATLSTTRSYEDGEVLVEADLDAFLDDIETFINTTKFNDDNIQNSGITGSTKLLNASVTESKLAANAVTTLKIADSAVTTAKILDSNVTNDKLANEVLLQLIPTAMVAPYAGSSAPSGWLMCDGSPVLRTTYAALFAIIGVTHGQGDGVNSFNLPDYRGRFLRGVDGTAGLDPNKTARTAMNTGGNTGNAVGTVQGGATALPNTAITTTSDGAHTHTYLRTNISSSGGGNGGLWEPTQSNPNDIVATSSDGAHTHTLSTGGDDETRPVNAYVYYIIKT